jgi:hypothetical protein
VTPKLLAASSLREAAAAAFLVVVIVGYVLSRARTSTPNLMEPA